MESAFVPVFLKEFLRALWFLVAQLLRALEVLLEPLFFWQGASSFDFLAFLFPKELSLLLFLYSAELAQPPRLELRLGVQSIRIVNVRDVILLLLC